MELTCPIQFQTEGWRYFSPAPQDTKANASLRVSVWQENGILGVVAYIFKFVGAIFTLGFLVGVPVWTTTHEQKVVIEEYESPIGTRELSTVDAELLLRRAQVESINARSIAALKNANRYSSPAEGQTHRANSMYRIVKKYVDGNLVDVSLLLYTRAISPGKYKPKERKLYGKIEHVEIFEKSEEALIRKLNRTGVVFSTDEGDFPLEVAEAVRKSFPAGNSIKTDDLVRIVCYLETQQLVSSHVARIRVVRDPKEGAVGLSIDLGLINRFGLWDDEAVIRNTFIKEKTRLAVHFEINSEGRAVLLIVTKKAMEKRIHEDLKKGVTVSTNLYKISPEILKELAQEFFQYNFTLPEFLSKGFRGIPSVVAKTHFTSNGEKWGVSFNLGKQGEAQRAKILLQLQEEYLFPQALEVATKLDENGDFIVMIQNKALIGELREVQQRATSSLRNQRRGGTQETRIRVDQEARAAIRDIDMAFVAVATDERRG